MTGLASLHIGPQIHKSASLSLASVVGVASIAEKQLQVDVIVFFTLFSLTDLLDVTCWIADLLAAAVTSVTCWFSFCFQSPDLLVASGWQWFVIEMNLLLT